MSATKPVDIAQEQFARTVFGTALIMPGHVLGPHSSEINAAEHVTNADTWSTYLLFITLYNMCVCEVTV